MILTHLSDYGRNLSSDKINAWNQKNLICISAYTRARARTFIQILIRQYSFIVENLLVDKSSPFFLASVCVYKSLNRNCINLTT